MMTECWGGARKGLALELCTHYRGAGQGRAGQGRAGQGRAGQGRAGQGRAGQDTYLPAKEFRAKCILDSFFRFPNSGGIVPERWLSFNRRTSKAEHVPSTTGIGPAI